jgi:class 3 adenylate cyclase
MAIQPTFLLIADIAGYTRFMKLHKWSLVHAQDIVARLLEAVIDACEPHLKLAKLEGDAAFFYLAFPAGAEPDLAFVAQQVAAIYRAFHLRASDLAANTLCPCDGCQQAGELKIKLVGHVGEVAVQKVKQYTELAGVDVILVHRLLKNAVPVPEYLLVTDPVYRRIDAAARERSTGLELELEELGKTAAFYLDLERYVAEVPAAPRLPFMARIARHTRLAIRTLPYALGLRKPCAGFHNVPDAA